MSKDKTVSRRAIVKYSGVAAATGLIAGCGGPADNESEDGGNGVGNGNGNDTGNGVGNGNGNDTGNGDNETDGMEDNETDVGEDNETAGEDNETDEMEDNETEGNETDGNETAGNGDISEWEGVDTIELDGYTEAWEGVSPSPIEGEENPTLVLMEGESYEITWTNQDGAAHNIAMLDENEEVVEDFETELIDGEGEEQTLEFEATEEIVEYYCEVHPDTMRGEVQIESGGGNGGAGNETAGNETAGNETEA